MALLQIHQLHEARDRILLLLSRIESIAESELEAFRPALHRIRDQLKHALAQAAIPERYKVAIVGRFKVGKSSFVNTLLNEQLAGVNSQPETAAISVLRYADRFRAEIELVSREEWDKLTQRYRENPQDPAVKRVERFKAFNSRSNRKDEGASTRESYDLKLLEDRWIIPGGKVHTIEMPTEGNKTDRKLFNSEIRSFTSSQKPLHLLVNKLTIYAPVPFLRDSVELIDTPGLDDTERFRVFLTEELVRDVDAILFLTTSGAAYGQSDKEFILRQLRRKQIKHLQIVVTKCDETYKNTVRDAEENDDEPPSYDEFCKKELARVRAEAQDTLNELLDSNSVSDDDGFYFMQQLDEVPIHLVSKQYHVDGDLKKGGIEQVRETLFTQLSEGKRFESSYEILDRALETALTALRRGFDERISTLEAHFDPRKVKEEIESIRSLLSSHLDKYAKQSEGAIGYLRKDQETFFKLAPTAFDYIAILGKEVLSDLEKDDLATHWKTRRYRGWGSVVDLQNRVADRVFPKVEVLLNQLREQFEHFLSSELTRLESLRLEIEQVEASQRITGLPELDFASTEIGNEIIELLQESMEGEKDSIVTNLEDFVSEQVYDRLFASKDAVTSIVGTGTTAGQNVEVRKFYAEIRTLLGDALREHVSQRVENFSDAIIAAAESVAPQARESVTRIIESRISAIASTMELENVGEREKLAAHLGQALSQVTNFAADPLPLEAAEPSVSKGDEFGDKRIIGRDNAKDGLKERHYEIEEEAIGFTYERIFRPYIDNAKHIVVEDAYIIHPYQVNNFARFCALAIRQGVVKSIELLSGTKAMQDAIDDADSRLETLRRDLETRGVKLNYSRSSTIHDREIRFDNGWTVKVGRGLDIYKRPENWEAVDAHDFALRACKQTKVDVYEAFE